MALSRRRRGRGGVLTLEQFGELVDDLPQELEVAVLRGLKSTAMRAVVLIVEEIESADPYPPVNTGALRQSIKWAALPGGNGFQVFSDAPHFPFMEYGTRPHMPPVAPLVTWATRKFGVGEKEATAIAWAVATKISVVGIAPRGFFAKGMARARQEVEAEIIHELEALT